MSVQTRIGGGINLPVRWPKSVMNTSLFLRVPICVFVCEIYYKSHDWMWNIKVLDFSWTLIQSLDSDKQCGHWILLSGENKTKQKYCDLRIVGFLPHRFYDFTRLVFTMTRSVAWHYIIEAPPFSIIIFLVLIKENAFLNKFKIFWPIPMTPKEFY